MKIMRAAKSNSCFFEVYMLEFVIGRVTCYGWIPEWPKGTDCKSAAICFGGSNPPPSIVQT